ncbi:hypothetical protein EAX62_07860 [Tessaracoccus antarcticus]|uniref:Uncharacterized protein n=1 Tax=Tessaracoccus antarcticus TaxID=2479848 RepID=A0A3M0G3W6_9ACTN|nr:hypothetical protein EAX62_07860 [Tessaracoccus antarcticus]
MVQENSQGPTAEAATRVCADATETKLEIENPGSKVIVPRTEPLVAALRSDTAPVLTSILLR